MKPRNVINPEEVASFVQRLSRDRSNPHIVAWINSTFKKWLLQESEAFPVMDSRELNSPWLPIIEAVCGAVAGKPLGLRGIIEQTVHIVDVSSSEPWIATALTERQALFFVPTTMRTQEIEVWNHWFDYLETLQPDKQLRQTVNHVINAVGIWDKQLARQKLVGSLNEGVELVEHPLFAEHKEPVALVRLVEKIAYENEGAIMNHCVGRAGYFDRKDSLIYSLRHANETRPLATIEIRLKNQQKQVVQVKAFANASPEDWVRELLDSWFASEGMSTVSYNEVDEYEDEDEYDEDEEEGEEDEDDEGDEDGDDELPNAGRGQVAQRPNYDRIPVDRETSDFREYIATFNRLQEFTRSVPLSVLRVDSFNLQDEAGGDEVEDREVAIESLTWADVLPGFSNRALRLRLTHAGHAGYATPLQLLQEIARWLTTSNYRPDPSIEEMYTVIFLGVVPTLDAGKDAARILSAMIDHGMFTFSQ